MCYPGLGPNCQSRDHQCGVRGHQVVCKDQVGRLCAFYKNNISLMNVFTLTNINTKIVEGKSRKIFISEVCTKLVALRINMNTKSSSQLQKGW